MYAKSHIMFEHYINMLKTDICICQDLKFLRAMIEDDNQFLEITALGSELAWRVMKLWMQSAGRTLNNYQAMRGYTAYRWMKHQFANIETRSG